MDKEFDNTENQNIDDKPITDEPINIEETRENDSENSNINEDWQKLRQQYLNEFEAMEQRIDEHEKIKTDISDRAAQNTVESEEIKRDGRWAGLIVAIVLVVICALSFASLTYIKPYISYKKAVAMLDEGQYDNAAVAFRALGDYKDSKELINESVYRKAESLMKNGKAGLALAQYTSIKDYKDSKDKINEYIGSGDGIIAVGENHSVALNSIGRVLSAGDNTYWQCNVSDWNGIKAVAAGANHTIGLCEDGSVVAVGSNGYGQCDVSGWHDIVYVAAAGNTSYGLRSDGTLVAAGDNAYGQCNVATEAFTKVKKVVCGGEYVLALKEDGTVAMAGNTAKLASAQSWTDIEDISALSFTVCALKNDGTVLACGDIDPTAVADWKDIQYVSAGYCYAVAITKDGETLSTTTLPEVLKGALRIVCGTGHILALESDGSVVSVGKNAYGECDVKAWCDVMVN